VAALAIHAAAGVPDDDARISEVATGIEKAMRELVRLAS
jgi:hypothetical protein